MHPVLICISLICGTMYLLYLKGVKDVLKSFRYMIVMVLMIVIINPMFNHEGATILYYLSNGNPITKESIIYGIFMALLLVSVINWCGCYNIVVTSDKFIYLFGRIIPHFSLILSMILRYIPRFKIQFRQVKEARAAIYGDITKGNIIRRIKNFANIISAMISWSLENSIETSDSMRARGYGMKGRTSFSIYRFQKRDGIVCGCIFCCISIVAYGLLSEKMYYRYYPTFESNLFEIKMIGIYIVYTLMCIIPLIINYMED
jgi:energy-coupling factor transport system permease protein